MWHGLVQGMGTRGKIGVIEKRQCTPREKGAENDPTQLDVRAHLACVRQCTCTLDFTEPSSVSDLKFIH